MHAEPTERKTLKRLPRTDCEQPRYFHPYGYVIERDKRSWGERTGRMQGSADHCPPMYWWTVYHHIARRRSILDGKTERILLAVSDKYPTKDFDSLRDARAWCDEHPREGWL